MSRRTRTSKALRGVPVASMACVAVLAYTNSAHSASLSITGPEQTIFDWSQMACDSTDVPDGPARAFRDADNQVQLFRAGPNRRMIGPDLDHLTNDCTVLKAQGMDPFPWHFNQYHWVTSFQTSDGATINALVHSEYHAVDTTGFCPSNLFLRCHYTVVTSATSTNGGDSYVSDPSPSHLVAGIPYPYVPDHGRVGAFSPSNIVEKDGYYYAMVLISAGYKAQRAGVCLMRTRDVSDNSSWRAWDGAGFTIRFINPYLEPSADPLTHKCHPVAFGQIGQIERSLTYNSYLNKYFVIGTDTKFDPSRLEPVRGIYYSFSDDLIHWTDKQLLIETPNCVPNQVPGFGAYPSILDPSSPDRNFNRIGRTAYMYFVRANSPSCAIVNDRDLLRVPIEFAL